MFTKKEKEQVLLDLDSIEKAVERLKETVTNLRSELNEIKDVMQNESDLTTSRINNVENKLHGIADAISGSLRL